VGPVRQDRAGGVRQDKDILKKRMKLRIPRKVTRSITRFFNIVLGALAMLTVALVSAFITMRLAIHGSEVKVPDLANLTLSEASQKTSSLGLVLSLENRFYSPNTPPGRVLAQSPAPGLTVRREWPVRITESLGAQQVAIPDLLGQTERTATINIRRLGLELGAVSHIAAPGEPGVVIAQTPTPNAIGVDRPRVSLLISDPETTNSAEAFVMPSLAGLTLTAAASRATSAGLHIASAEDLNLNSTSEAAPLTAQSPPSATTLYPEPIARTVSSIGTVIGQTPPAGHRVVKGDPVHITLTD